MKRTLRQRIWKRGMMTNMANQNVNLRTRLAKFISPVNLHTDFELDSYLVKNLGERDLTEALESGHGKAAFNLATTYACTRIVAMD